MVLKKISRAERQLGLTELTVNSCFSALSSSIYIGFLCLAELCQFFQAICHFNHISPIATNHAFLCHIVQKGDGGGPEAFHVVENHHLVMVADGVGGGDGEDFIQGTDAARKGYEDVALGKHQVLAVAEIITRNLDVEVWEGSASSLYKRRNHTMVLPPCAFTALPMQSIRPELQPPKTRSWPFSAIHFPISSVNVKKSGSIFLFAEQKTAIFILLYLLFDNVLFVIYKCFRQRYVKISRLLGSF